MAMSEEERLDQLWAAYRAACPDPEPGPGFMPGLWSKIEARRRSARLLRRWTGAFVAAATALSLFMAVHSVREADAAVHALTYVDALSTDEPFETLVYGELAQLDKPGTLEIQ
jgi:hypothetical protein